jgi:outer membrane protein
MRKGILAALALVLLAAGTAHAKDIKIGLLNFEYIIKNSEEFLEASAALKEKYKDESQEMEKMMGDIKIMAEDIRKQSMVLSQEAKADKQMEFNRMRRDFEDQRQVYMRQMKAETDKLVKEVSTRITKVVGEYSEKNNYNYVVDVQMSGVIYADKEMNLTKDILVEVNRDYRDSKKPKVGKK